MKQQSLRIAGILLGILSLIACSSLPSSSEGLNQGKILLTPPRNVVQNGEPHKEGKDSGQHLEDVIKRKLESANEFEVVVSDSGRFSHTENVDPDTAQQEAQKKNADYFLIITLGEFLDAAPMTFRSDIVTLQQADLYDTKTKNTVWSLTEPFTIDKTNIGSYHSLLNEIGTRIVEDLRSYVTK